MRAGYQAIKESVVAKITSRQWPPGHLLPPEIELAKQFDCARATVNRALTELAEEGIIQRKRKAGSRVCDYHDRKIMLKLDLPFKQCVAPGAERRYVQMRRQTVPFPTTMGMEQAVGETSALLIQGVHYENNRPSKCEQTWICLDALPQAQRKDFFNLAPTDWLAEEMPLSNGSVSLFASVADKFNAACLGVRIGEPVFIHECLLTRSQTVVAMVRSFNNGNYRLQTSF